MSKEEIKCIIPNYVTKGKGGFDSNVIFLTSERLIIIQTHKGYHFFGGGVAGGGLIGGIIHGIISGTLSGILENIPMQNKKNLDNLNLQELLDQNKENRAISKENITEVRFYKAIKNHALMIYGLNKKGKSKKFVQGNLVPPFEKVEEKKKMGLKEKIACNEYAIEVQNMFDYWYGNIITRRIEF